MSNELKQLAFKLEKNIGIQKYAGKVRKMIFIYKQFHYIKLRYCKKATKFEKVLDLTFTQ